MSFLARWANDLVLGVRLAVGGGRTSKTGLIRLLLGTLGVGLAVLVLLIGSAVQPAMDAREQRERAQNAIQDPVAGVDPLHIVVDDTEFRGVPIDRMYVQASGSTSPRPPGVDRLPGPGESVVSPALAELLASADSELLRPRMSERVIGTVAPAGLVKPSNLVAYIGPAERIQPDEAVAVYGFGFGWDSPEMPAYLWITLVVGVVTLLVPVFIFIATSSRIAGAERDRRLAALRLVGSDARQVRRIAAAESLVSAAAGLVFGTGLFLLLRASAASIELGGESFYPDDLTPRTWLVVLILLIVPALSVITTQLALRHTIIEPLGLVRLTKPVPRRVGWRLGAIAAGVTMLLVAEGERAQDTAQMLLIITGATLLLIGVPMMLPWLLERLVSRFGGSGSPAFQLASRRLQLDAGTPARVIGGLAVVLAGAIALQTVLMGQLAKYNIPAGGERESAMFMSVDDKFVDPVWASLNSTPGVQATYMVRTVTVQSSNEEIQRFGISVADCAMISRILDVATCTDGDAFVVPALAGPVPPLDATVHVLEDNSYSSSGTGPKKIGTVQLPRHVTETEIKLGQYASAGNFVLTPGALSITPGVPMRGYGSFVTTPGDPDAMERTLNALAPHSRHVHLTRVSEAIAKDAAMFLEVRKGLLIGSLFTLLMAGVGLLVVSLDQIRERRRVIAALSASGVPVKILARSLLWQNAIPMLLAMVAAIATGLGLAALVFRLTNMRFTLDWENLAMMASTAGLLILLITVMTLPTLRSATRLAALRTE